jgi:hypothetical protein
MVMPALRKLVLNFVEFVHLPPVILGGELAERVAATPFRRVSWVFGDATLRTGRLLAGAVGGVTILTFPSLELPSHTGQVGILSLLMLTFELLAESGLDLGVEEADAVAYTLELLQMEPVGHTIARFYGGRKDVLETG